MMLGLMIYIYMGHHFTKLWRSLAWSNSTWLNGKKTQLSLPTQLIEAYTVLEFLQQQVVEDPENVDIQEQERAARYHLDNLLKAEECTHKQHSSDLAINLGDSNWRNPEPRSLVRPAMSNQLWLTHRFPRRGFPKQTWNLSHTNNGLRKRASNLIYTIHVAYYHLA